MNRRRRRRVLILIVACFLPVALIGGAVWYVEGGQLRARLEAAWTLPGRLSVGAVHLVGLDRLQVDDLQILDESGQPVLSIDSLEAGDGLWSLAPDDVVASGWHLRVDAETTPFFDRLRSALAARSGSDRSAPAAVRLSAGRLTCFDQTFQDVAVTWADGQLRIDDGSSLGLRLDSRDDGRVVTWERGQLPLAAMLADLVERGDLPGAWSSHSPSLPSTVELAGSSLQLGSDGAWQAHVQAAWSDPVTGHLQVDCGVAGDTYHLALLALDDPRLPSVQVADAELSWRGRPVATGLQISGTLDGRSGSAAATMGAGGPLRIDWGHIGDQPRCDVSAGTLARSDLAAFGLSAAWLPETIDLTGTTWQYGPGGDARVAAQLRWPGGRLDASLQTSADAWELRCTDFRDRRLADRLQVDGGTWQMGQEIVADDLIIAGQGLDAGSLTIDWAAADALRATWTTGERVAVTIDDGVLPGGSLLRWLLATGVVARLPSDAPGWCGDWVQAQGTTVVLGPDGAWELAARLAGADWQGELTLGPSATGFDLRDVQIDHQALGSLTGSASLAAERFTCRWSTARLGPAAEAAIGPWCSWPALADAVTDGQLQWSAADGLLVTGTGNDGFQARFTMDRNQVIAVTGSAVPLAIGQVWVPPAITIDAGTASTFSLRVADDSLDLQLDLATADCSGADWAVAGLTGSASARRRGDALDLVVSLPQGEATITVARPSAEAATLTIACADIATLAKHVARPTLPLAGRLDLAVAAERHETGWHGRIERLEGDGLAWTGWVDDGACALSGAFHQAGEALEVDLNGELKRLSVLLFAQRLALDALRLDLAAELTVSPQVMLLHGLLARERNDDGTYRDQGTSIGASAERLADGTATWSVILDRVRPAFIKEQCPWLPLPMGVTVEQPFTLLIDGSQAAGQTPSHAFRILPQGNDISYDAGAVEVRGLRGLIRILMAEDKEDDDAATAE